MLVSSENRQGANKRQERDSELKEFEKSIINLGLRVDGQNEANIIFDISLLLNPSIFKFKLDELRYAKKELKLIEEKRIKSSEQRLKSEAEDFETITKKLFEVVNCPLFLESLYMYAGQIEDKTYSISYPKINPKSKYSKKGSFGLGYEMKDLVTKSVKAESKFISSYPEDILSSDEEAFVRRSAVIMDFNFWNRNNNNSCILLDDIHQNLQIGLSYFEPRFFCSIVENTIFTGGYFLSGLNFVYSINPNKNLQEFIINTENTALKYSDIEVCAEQLFYSYYELRTNYINQNIKNKKKETVLEFFQKLINQLNEFTKRYSSVKDVTESKISQEQLDLILNASYWEIQQLKVGEGNPELVMYYNHRLVELVNQGIEEAVDLVIETPKLQKLYLEKNYQDFLWAMNSIIGIEFINKDGVNPSGDRVLEKLKGSNFESDERKIILDITNHIKKIVDDLKLSGGVHEVSAAEKFYCIVAEIEKYGGVSQFWFNFLSHKNSLSYNIHIGRNKNGRNFDGCALITLAEGYGVAVHRKTNQIIFVGDYHPG